ncbi:MAG: hypothetical protein JWQ43_3599, partial [Glaciihabitans sp.]|nr:hypothetical protein [Glaciihabitans sp.]
KLIPVIGAPALLGRRPWPIIAGSVTAFALLYVPYVLASGGGVLGFLPTYFGEEGYGSGRRFVLLSLIAPGAASTVLAVLLIGVTGAMVWWKSTPANPWVGQVVMIGTTLLILTPRYAWYALLLVPMIAMAGRWEWLAVPLALTVRLLIGDPTVGRVAIAVAIVFIIVVSLKRAGPGVLGRIGALPAEAWHDFRSLRIGRASQHPPATGEH